MSKVSLVEIRSFLIHNYYIYDGLEKEERKTPYLDTLRYTLSNLRAQNARAVTGRWCPHSGKGEDFLTGQLNFFTETAVIPERKVKKSFPMWEINRHAEG